MRPCSHQDKNNGCNWCPAGIETLKEYLTFLNFFPTDIGHQRIYVLWTMTKLSVYWLWNLTFHIQIHIHNVIENKNIMIRMKHYLSRYSQSQRPRPRHPIFVVPSYSSRIVGIHWIKFVYHCHLSIKRFYLLQTLAFTPCQLLYQIYLCIRVRFYYHFIFFIIHGNENR